MTATVQRHFKHSFSFLFLHSFPAQHTLGYMSLPTRIKKKTLYLTVLQWGICLLLEPVKLNRHRIVCPPAATWLTFLYTRGKQPYYILLSPNAYFDNTQTGLTFFLRTLVRYMDFYQNRLPPRIGGTTQQQISHILTDWLFLPASVIILLQIKISQLHQMAFFCLRKRTISEIRADYILIVAYREFPVPFKLLPYKLLGQPMQVGFRTAMLITAAMRKMPRPNFPQPGYQLRTATQTAISVAMPAFRLNLIYTDEPVMLIQSMMIHHF